MNNDGKEQRVNQDSLFTLSAEEWANQKSTGTFSNVLTEPMAPSIDKLREAVRQIQAQHEAPYGYAIPSYYPSLTERVGIRKVEGEWVDMKEKQVTRVFDRHGTEILKGDVLASSINGCPKHQLPNRVENPLCYVGIELELTVLSRADGTPVYRYKGGEDVRAGDVFGYCGDDITVHGFTTKHGGCVISTGPDGSYYAPSACTLIRRAGENQLDAVVREATKPTPRCVACGSETYLCGQDGRCPECNYRKTIAEARKAPSAYPAGIYGVWVDESAPFAEAQFKVLAERTNGKNAAIAIDRFADWLNQPTLSQRFEAFRWRVEKRIASAKFVTAVFDCDSRSGPMVRLEIQPGLSAMDSWCIFYEPATDRDIVNQLNAWSKSLGQEVVRGRLKVSK